jgi:hypothetical protein
VGLITFKIYRPFKQMFFYLICNASIGNYQESRKKYLTTFIYGTIIYILLHAFLHTSNSHIALYLKSYFWIILGLDCAAMYYLYVYINESDESNMEEKKNLQSLVNSFFNQVSGSDPDQAPETSQDKKEEDNPVTTNKTTSKTIGATKTTNNDSGSDLEPKAYTETENSLQSTPLSDLPFDKEEYVEDDQKEYDNGSDSGSDVDLDKFEMTLQ